LYGTPGHVGSALLVGDMCTDLFLERHGGIVAIVFQQIVHGDHLRDDGDVLAGSDGKVDKGNLRIENGDRVVIQAGALHLAALFPEGELKHHFQPFLIADGADPEHRHYIDDPESPDLHKVLVHFGGGGHQHTALLGKHHHIVRYKPVTTLQQVQGDLAFADS